MTTETSAVPTVTTVLLADSKPMESQLLAGSLRHRGFEVLSCDGEVSSILEFVESGSVKIAVISSSAAHSGLPDMTALRTLHLTHPEIPKICLMETESRELAVQAFREHVSDRSQGDESIRLDRDGLVKFWREREPDFDHIAFMQPVQRTAFPRQGRTP